MGVSIKGWRTFQHYKDLRRPSWIKLYKSILDDPDWHQLPPAAAKTLVMLWLISSENDGRLPSFKRLSFRLRMPEKTLRAQVKQLDHYLIHDEEPPAVDDHDDPPPPPKEKKPEEEKISFAPNVKMTQAQYDDLVAKHGKEAALWMIDRLDTGKRAKGYVYKDDAAAIRLWVEREWRKHTQEAKSIAPESRKYSCPKCKRSVPAPEKGETVCGNCAIKIPEGRVITT